MKVRLDYTSTNMASTKVFNSPEAAKQFIIDEVKKYGDRFRDAVLYNTDNARLYTQEKQAQAMILFYDSAYWSAAAKNDRDLMKYLKGKEFVIKDSALVKAYVNVSKRDVSLLLAGK